MGGDVGVVHRLGDMGGGGRESTLPSPLENFLTRSSLLRHLRVTSLNVEWKTGRICLLQYKSQITKYVHKVSGVMFQVSIIATSKTGYTSKRLCLKVLNSIIREMQTISKPKIDFD
jgi:hypothetical protein